MSQVRAGATLSRILRANLELPEGQSAVNRTDIEVLFDRLPEPIDLDLDLDKTDTCMA